MIKNLVGFILVCGLCWGAFNFVERSKSTERKETIKQLTEKLSRTQENANERIIEFTGRIRAIMKYTHKASIDEKISKLEALLEINRLCSEEESKIEADEAEDIEEGD